MTGIYIQVTDGESNIINDEIAKRGKKYIEFRSFKSLQALLDRAAKDAPKGGAYDKVFYRVLIPSLDIQYNGRYDLHHPDYGNEEFTRYLFRRFCQTMTMVSGDDRDTFVKAAAMVARAA